jgi:hypothetical protein
MNKKERYYDFIIEDLISHTEIIDNISVRFPFTGGGVKYTIVVLDLTKSAYNSRTNFDLAMKFFHYVNTTYGVKEEEMDLLWRRYANEITTKFKDLGILRF